MRRILLFILSVGLAGCGGPASSGSAAVQAPSGPPGLPTSTRFPAATSQRELAAAQGPWYLARRAPSAEKAVAGTPSVSLNTGWNAVAFQGARVTSLIPGANIAGMAAFDGSAYQLTQFTAAEVNAGAGARRGLWVFCQAPTSFTYTAGDDAQGRALNLRGGWNLVSFADPGPVANLKTETGGREVPLNSVLLTAFTRINADNGYTTVDVTRGGSLDTTRPYWIFAAADATLKWTSPDPTPSPTAASSPAATASPSPSGGGGGGGGGATGGTPPAASPTPTPVTAPAGLRFVSAGFPTGSIVAGTAFSATFEVLDGRGMRVASPAVTASLALESGSVPFGSTLTGATPQTSSNGLVTFSGLSVDKTGSYRFRATSGTLNPGVTSMLLVDVGPPARLAFTSYPRIGTVNEALGGAVPIHVELQDAQGNPAFAGVTTPVTLGLAVPGGATITDGGLPPTADITATEAFFYSPLIDQTGTYRLTASTTVPGIAPATMPEDLTIYDQDLSGDIAGLQLGTIPSGPTPAGTSLGPVTIEVLSSLGGVLTTADGVIELRICGCGAAPGSVNEIPTTLGPSSGPRQTTLTAPVVNGVATFSAANGNDISFIRAGTWSVTATYSKGTLYTAFFPPLQFDPGPTARLAFDPTPFAFPSAAGPTDVGAVQPSPSPVAVQARDAWGNDNSSEAGTVSLDFNTAGNPLASATPVAATSGLATFDTWMVPSGRLGVQTLLATLGSVTGLSNPFTVWIEPTDLDSAGVLPSDRVFSTGPNTVSADGRYVVFEQRRPSSSTFDVWRRDRQTGTTTLVSAGAEATTDCFYPAISPDGKLVTFTGWGFDPAEPLFGVTGHNGAPQIFLWSETGPLQLVSHTASGVPANGPSAGSDVNDAGTVVYTSEARNLVSGKSLPFGSLQVYAASGAGLTNQLVSETPAGRGMNMPASLGIGCMPSISATGHVAFQAFVPGDNLPGARDFTFAVYRRDLAASPGLVLVSDNGTGTSADHQCWWPAISDDGRYVAFTSAAPDLPDPSALGSFQVYRRDCNGSTMLCVSTGLQVPAGSFNPGSTYPCLSADGRYVAFLSSDELAGVYTPSFASVIWRRDCNSAGAGAFALMTKNSSGQPLEVPTGFLSTPADAWPSLAGDNPTLCGFVAEEEAGYGYWGGTGQVYMTYTP